MDAVKLAGLSLLVSLLFVMCNEGAKAEAGAEEAHSRLALDNSVLSQFVY